ncbi:MAG: transcription antitermination factor NusB [Patescibacteria group bacterium]
MARKRHLARIAVMQTLFERDSRSVDTDSTLERNCGGQEGETDAEFASTLLAGVLSKEEDIKIMVQKHAPGWTLERMDPVSRCTLLLGCFELLYGNDAPPAVVMNEAIEVAKEFGTPESGKFVNGVLNAIAHGEKK